jgi:putative ABC transport system permease protein
MSFLRRFRNLLFPTALDREIEDEIQSHLAMRTSDNIAAGMPPEEARRSAVLRFGNPIVTKEKVTREDSAPGLASAWRDLHFAFRRLRKTPGFTVAVVLILTLGIGTASAFFSIVEAVLLRPLPYADPSRLVKVDDHLEGTSITAVTAREVNLYQNALHSLSGTGGYTGTTLELSGVGEPLQVHAVRLTSSVFPTLGVDPMLGRVFSKEEDERRDPVAILSYGLWSSRFDKDPRVLGRSFSLDRKPYTIIGVMPKAFAFPITASTVDEAQLWVPMSFTATDLSEEMNGFWGYHMIGRLAPGITVKQANKDMDRVAEQVMLGFPPSLSRIRIRGEVAPYIDSVVARTRPMLRALSLAVLFVLLIACVNVAGLLLLRSMRRRREYAVRLALGARPGTLVRDAVIEALLLGLTGGALGIGFAAAILRTTLYFIPRFLPRSQNVSLDAGVLSFALVASLLTSLACSLAPAIAAIRTDLNESLKQGAGSGASGTGLVRLRSVLVVAQIAIAFILLNGSGVLLRSFEKMRAVDPGFVTDHVLVAGYQLPLKQYENETAVNLFQSSLLENLRTKPGFLAAGMTNILPASGFDGGGSYTVEGERGDPKRLRLSMLSFVTSDYFRAMGIRLIDGRYFSEVDRPDGLPVVIVNQTFAQRAWPGQRALGKRIHTGTAQMQRPWATVVGVVADTKLGSRDEPGKEQFFALEKQLVALHGPGGSHTLSSPAGGYIVLRSALPPEQMSEILRSSVATVDPLLALHQIRSMDSVLSSIEAPRRFGTGLVSVFAMGALLLAATGIYAVMAFSVFLRAREMAIRVSLGAPRRNVAHLVLRSGIKLALAGCVIGLLGSIAVAQLLQSMLFDTSVTDPLVLGGAMLCVIALALTASAPPALRAAATNPVTLLRAD